MRVIVLLGMLVAAAGCVSTNAAILNPTAMYAKTCPEAVIVFTTPDRVGREYVEVALLNSTGEADFTSERGMIESQQRKAAEVGGNGLILGGIQEPGAGAKVAGAIFGVSTDRKGKALAIWIPDDSVKTQATCALAARR